jgi:hypothetical protein
METEEKIVEKIADFMWEIALIQENPNIKYNTNRLKEELKTILKEFKQEILKSTAQHTNHLGF